MGRPGPPPTLLARIETLEQQGLSSSRIVAQLQAEGHSIAARSVRRHAAAAKAHRTGQPAPSAATSGRPSATPLRVVDGGGSRRAALGTEAREAIGDGVLRRVLMAVDALIALGRVPVWHCSIRPLSRCQPARYSTHRPRRLR
jgi:hypothetical protein